jgi:hypothetical protein
MPHTPAPWLICDATELKHIGYRAIVTIDGETICTPSPMGNADAALITAAPDLLAALQKARYMVWHEAGDDAAGAPWKALLVEIDAAIAKATA